MRTYALERDIERLQSRLTSAEEDYADAEKSLDAARADLRAAEGRVEELEAKLLAAAREALAVLTRLADSAHRWAGRDVPAGLVAEVDAAKARLAGVLGE